MNFGYTKAKDERTNTIWIKIAIQNLGIFKYYGDFEVKYRSGQKIKKEYLVFLVAMS
jgi:hypothetical protein